MNDLWHEMLFGYPSTLASLWEFEQCRYCLWEASDGVALLGAILVPKLVAFPAAAYMVWAGSIAAQCGTIRMVCAMCSPSVSSVCVGVAKSSAID